MDTGEDIDISQLKKMSQDIKTTLKKKIDIRQTGNKKIMLLPQEKVMLDFMDYEHYPVHINVPGGKECDIVTIADDIPCISVPQPTTNKKIYKELEKVSQNTIANMQFKVLELHEVLLLQLKTDNRKETSRNAARQRRSCETQIFKEMLTILPCHNYSNIGKICDSLSSNMHIDKISLVRISLAYIKLRQLLQYEHWPTTLDYNYKSMPFEKENSNDDKNCKKLLSTPCDATNLLKLLDSFFLILSENGIILYVSNNAEHYLGLSKICLLGQSITEFIHPDDVEDFLAKLKKESEVLDKNNTNDLLINSSDGIKVKDINATLINKGNIKNDGSLGKSSKNSQDEYTNHDRRREDHNTLLTCTINTILRFKYVYNRICVPHTNTSNLTNANIPNYDINDKSGNTTDSLADPLQGYKNDGSAKNENNANMESKSPTSNMTQSPFHITLSHPVCRLNKSVFNHQQYKVLHFFGHSLFYPNKQTSKNLKNHSTPNLITDKTKMENKNDILSPEPKRLVCTMLIATPVCNIDFKNAIIKSKLLNPNSNLISSLMLDAVLKDEMEKLQINVEYLNDIKPYPQIDENIVYKTSTISKNNIVDNEQYKLQSKANSGLLKPVATLLSKHRIDMKIMYFDERVADVLGYDIWQLVGRSFYDLIHILDLERFRSDMERLNVFGQIKTGIYRLLVKQGGFAWVSTQACVVDNAIDSGGILTEKPEISNGNNNDTYNQQKIDLNSQTTLLYNGTKSASQTVFNHNKWNGDSKNGQLSTKNDVTSKNGLANNKFSNLNGYHNGSLNKHFNVSTSSSYKLNTADYSNINGSQHFNKLNNNDFINAKQSPYIHQISRNGKISNPESNNLSSKLQNYRSSFSPSCYIVCLHNIVGFRENPEYILSDFQTPESAVKSWRAIKLNTKNLLNIKSSPTPILSEKKKDDSQAIKANNSFDTVHPSNIVQVHPEFWRQNLVLNTDPNTNDVIEVNPSDPSLVIQNPFYKSNFCGNTTSLRRNNKEEKSIDETLCHRAPSLIQQANIKYVSKDDIFLLDAPTFGKKGTHTNITHNGLKKASINRSVKRNSSHNIDSFSITTTNTNNNNTAKRINKKFSSSLAKDINVPPVGSYSKMERPDTIYYNSSNLQKNNYPLTDMANYDLSASLANGNHMKYPYKTYKTINVNNGVVKAAEYPSSIEDVLAQNSRNIAKINHLMDSGFNGSTNLISPIDSSSSLHDDSGYQESQLSNGARRDSMENIIEDIMSLQEDCKGKINDKNMPFNTVLYSPTKDESKCVDDIKKTLLLSTASQSLQQGKNSVSPPPSYIMQKVIRTGNPIQYKNLNGTSLNTTNTYQAVLNGSVPVFRILNDNIDKINGNNLINNGVDRFKRFDLYKHDILENNALFSSGARKRDLNSNVGPSKLLNGKNVPKLGTNSVLVNLLKTGEDITNGYKCLQNPPLNFPANQTNSSLHESTSNNINYNNNSFNKFKFSTFGHNYPLSNDYSVTNIASKHKLNLPVSLYTNVTNTDNSRKNINAQNNMIEYNMLNTEAETSNTDFSFLDYSNLNMSLPDHPYNEILQCEMDETGNDTLMSPTLYN